MAKPFSKLRHALDDADVGRTDVASCLGVSLSYVALRMQGKYSWTLEDAYRVLDLLKKPHSEISEYFPRGGVES